MDILEKIELLANFDCHDGTEFGETISQAAVTIRGFIGIGESRLANNLIKKCKELIKYYIESADPSDLEALPEEYFELCGLDPNKYRVRKEELRMSVHVDMPSGAVYRDITLQDLVGKTIVKSGNDVICTFISERV